jgi:hypothetical protein
MWFLKTFGRFGDRIRWFNPAYIVAWYVEFLLRSIPGFLLAIVVWILGLSVLYGTTTRPAPTLSSAVENAFVSFFSMQPPNDMTGISFGFVVLAILGGVLHVGVLISHLYAIVSRR